MVDFKKRFDFKANDKNLRHLEGVKGLRKIIYAKSANLSISEGCSELAEGRNLETGLFHKWVKLERNHHDTRENNIYALIEIYSGSESGHMITVHCECVKFID